MAAGAVLPRWRQHLPHSALLCYSALYSVIVVFFIGVVLGAVLVGFFGCAASWVHVLVHVVTFVGQALLLLIHFHVKALTLLVTFIMEHVDRSMFVD